MSRTETRAKCLLKFIYILLLGTQFGGKYKANRIYLLQLTPEMLHLSLAILRKRVCLF